MSSLQSPRKLYIGASAIGHTEPAYIIAEIGINHNGSLPRAKELIRAAKAAGAQAVKFQKRHLRSIYTERVLGSLEHLEQGFQYLIPILREYELSTAQMRELKTYADELGIEFLCTPFDIDSAEFLESLGVPAFKVSSADLTNFVLLEKLVAYDKPLLLSCGMSSNEEVEATVRFLKNSDASFALLHCISCYPVDPHDARIKKIVELQAKFDCPVGYSGHDMGITLPIAARTLGACIIEKHFTLDRSLRGPDHKLSLLPEELKLLVKSIRETEAALSDEKSYILPAESLNKMVFRKSLVAKVPIKKGQMIRREMLAAKSPGTGLSVQKIGDLLGKNAVRDLQIDDTFLEKDLLGENGHHKKIVVPSWGRWGLVVRYHDFEQALPHNPEVLEFHLTYRDTELELPREALERHREKLSRMSLRVHCCEYVGEDLFDLLSHSEETLERSKKTLERVISIASELGEYFASASPMIIFNCGAMTLKNTNGSYTINHQRFFDIINSLDLAGTQLLAQNMPPNPWYYGGQWKGHFLIRPEQIVTFCKETGQGVCLDLSHAYMAACAEGIPFSDYLDALLPYVRHIHLADANSREGEGLQIGEGEIDFVEFFRKFQNYRGTWVPEIWLGHVNGYERAIEALSKLNSLNEKSQSGRQISKTKTSTQKTNGSCSFGYQRAALAAKPSSV